MENKYYTPEIEEFYVGFEFQMNDYIDIGQRDWIDSIYGNLLINKNGGQYSTDLSHAKKWIEDEDVRVKYLDKEDIESLAWEYGFHVNVWSEDSDIIEGFSIRSNNTDTYILMYSPEENVVGIYLQRVYNELTGNWEEIIMFSGIIKNKSELKKLMKQLNIS